MRFSWSLLLSPSIVLTAIRLFGAGLGFGIQVLLARLLSADELGLYYFITSTAMVAGLVFGHGYPNLLSRFIPRYTERGHPGRLSAFLRTAQMETVKGALVGTALLIAASWLAPGLDTETRWAFVFGALTVIPMCLFRIHGAIAIAYRMFIAGYMPYYLGVPVFFIVVLTALWFAGVEPSVLLMSVVQFGAYIAVALTTLYIIRHLYLGPAKPVYDARLARRWRREAWPQIVVVLFTAMLTDLAVMLAVPFMDFHEVAAFGICLKVAFLVGFAVQIAHQVLVPDMGEAIARRQDHAMGGKILAASLIPLALTVGGILFSMIFGGFLLGIFGDEFRHAQTTLTILMVAQLLRAVAGPAPFLLTLKGAQTANALICAGSAVVLAIGNALLAPVWGAEGAAISLLLTTAFWLVASAVMLYRIDGARTDLPALLLRRA